jgi:dTDP-4-amino-4,6-dideoxygalactose transaminase
MSLLPVMRPRLPDAQSLLPYLRQIDEARVYGNYGPLNTRLEERLAQHFGASCDAVTTVANATLGLAVALTAQGARPGSLCVMPAWTFIASAQAAILAGLVPYFVDVDPITWALDPSSIAELIEDAPGDVGAVMPVAPFGRPIDVAAWDWVRAATGIPMVIDAAAGFDTARPGTTPAVVSLHATKVLGIGEGGVVVCDDPQLARAIRTRANFGFYGSREAMVPALNAKMSEYHAAVGHAALDEWECARADWESVANHYRSRLEPSSEMRLQEGLGDCWVSSVCVVTLDGPDAESLASRLDAAGIETRRWWGDGAHAHRSTRDLPRTPLPVTERLARTTLGLPCFRDMNLGDIDRVADCMRAIRA